MYFDKTTKSIKPIKLNLDTYDHLKDPINCTKILDSLIKLFFALNP